MPLQGLRFNVIPRIVPNAKFKLRETKVNCKFNVLNVVRIFVGCVLEFFKHTPAKQKYKFVVLIKMSIELADKIDKMYLKMLQKSKRK